MIFAQRQQLGIELVRGHDLVVLDDDCVYVKTISGLERVHVVYRRLDGVNYKVADITFCRTR